jgi:hypothetical protein
MSMLIEDYLTDTPHSGEARIRIYAGSSEGVPVVIATELPDNPGMSITNAAERIAGEVISFHRLPAPLVWIEHYEDGARGLRRTRTPSTW